ncbi:hypothetical protein LFL96_11040 [Paraburkholderia sp. D15]|uniref:hypothetical protein n=1 Tax=Paraburkholderia sp. D15 TaxID=2880218 RepID=UPI002478ED68|nr:hypothetical protein [Paraburkholderia sp. D15]WGS51811.1 hypothetical protein LFL96_11040 [Paraburkholderia sp. D15]
MKRSRLTARTALTTGVAALYLFGAGAGLAFAQNMQPNPAPPANGAATMVKPPEAASGAHGSSDPDNMPIKRPQKPTNDHMSHPPPASGANAK